MTAVREVIPRSEDGVGAVTALGAAQLDEFEQIVSSSAQDAGLPPAVHESVDAETPPQT